MGFSARVLADSVPLIKWPNREELGPRLTTMEVTFPRIVLAEFNTHRMFSRNSASSRAIPVSKMLERVENDPFAPIWWGKNQKGMEAEVELSDEVDGTYALSDKPDPGWGYTSPRVRAKQQWYAGLRAAVEVVRRMQEPDIDLHKQIANRLLEPWLWHTVIVTATEWDNFWGLRRHKAAQPEMRRAADVMYEAFQASTPKVIQPGTWHLPLLQADEFVLPDNSPEWNEPVGSPCHLMTFEQACKVCVGRCARVSYLTHDGIRDWKEDVKLAERLLKSGHMSPFEHVARPMEHWECAARYGRKGEFIGDEIDPAKNFAGNFKGWVQYRKTLPNEDNFLARPAE